MKVISHDGFARETLVRETVTPFRGVTCAQCGGLSKKGKLYRYAYLPDDGSKQRRIDGYFCSVSCMRAYHA